MTEHDIIEGLELVQGWDAKSREALLHKVREFNALVNAFGRHYPADAAEVAMLAVTLKRGRING